MKKNKLLFVDKDWTIVKPQEGTFVQHPEDQVPMPGAIAAVSDYVSRGWLVAIVSNQGGVARRPVKVSQFPIGAYCLVGDTPVKVIGRRCIGRSVVLEYLAGGETETKKIAFNCNASVYFQYKTLADTIAEMQYCMRLFNVTDGGYFCPDEEGKECWHVWADWPVVSDRTGASSGALPIHPTSGAREFIGQFRKPAPGMILFQMKWAIVDPKDEVLFVGDMASDEQAAIAAKEKSDMNIRFSWTSDFLSPFI